MMGGVGIDLAASRMSELILVGPTPRDPAMRPEYRRVLLPADSTVRIAGALVRIPLGETRIVGPCDLTYELVEQRDDGLSGAA